MPPRDPRAFAAYIALRSLPGIVRDAVGWRVILLRGALERAAFDAKWRLVELVHRPAVWLDNLDTPAVCDECMGWNAVVLVDVPGTGLAEVCAFCADTLVDNCGARWVSRIG